MSTLKSGAEIERRFLLKGLPDDLVLLGCQRFLYETVYIYTGDPEVRLRKVTSLADGAMVRPTFSLAVKFGSGIVRTEFINDAPQELFEERAKQGYLILVKVRYKLRHDGLVWEIDDFDETFRGKKFYMAEAELGHMNQRISVPSCLKKLIVKEVTNDSMYNNRNLATFGIPK